MMTKFSPDPHLEISSKQMPRPPQLCCFPVITAGVSLEHIDHFLHRMPKDRPLKEYIDCDFKMEVSLVEQFIDDKDPSQGDELGKSTYYYHFLTLHIMKSQSLSNR